MLSFNDSKRLNTRLDELHSRLEGVLAVLNRLETEWMDTKDQVRKSYQRLEAAARRAGERADPPPPTNDIDPAAEAALDPYSRKMLQIRRQGGAIPSRIDESAG